LATDTFVQLRTALAQRGFDYLTQTQLGDYINNGYTDVCEAEDWPFLSTAVTDTVPITISDLRTVSYVLDITNQNKLRPIDRRNLTDITTDLTTAGVASYYYLTTSGTVVAVYPEDLAASFTVFYYKVPPDLSADSDTPLVPSRFRSLIVDAAVNYAYENDDETAQADSATARFNARLEAMKTSLMVSQHDEPDQWMVARDFAVWGGF
jgi:hypothetical protein